MSEKLKFGLLGENILYSKSPDIFSHIFELEDIDGEFILFDVDKDRIEATIEKIVDSGVTGFSVTIPHKKSIMQFMDEIDKPAKTIGAVNSVSVKDKKLTGFNTDYIGFAKPLEKYTDKIKDGKALVLGHGGSSRAIIFSLTHNFGIIDFTIAGRSLDKLNLFKSEILKNYNNININLLNYNDLLSSSDHYSIIINCTPLGGPNYSDKSPFSDSYSFQKESIYYDLNYNSDNYAVSKAEKAGMSVINGVPMLIAQAVESYNIWTGRNISFEEVFDKLKASL